MSAHTPEKEKEKGEKESANEITAFQHSIFLSSSDQGIYASIELLEKEYQQKRWLLQLKQNLIRR